ncbi:MAG: hypothetical protein O7C63_02710 [Alphaproteobacteria bacterium]|nr:hypothetical protein [Alphaproteobacteria bacterium]
MHKLTGANITAAAAIAAILITLIPSANAQRRGESDEPVTGKASAVEGWGDTMFIAEQRIKICGIDDTKNDASIAAFADIVDGQTVTCTLVGDGTPCDGRTPRKFYDSFNAQCFLDGGDDIADLMVDAGAAVDLPLISSGHYAR